MKKFPKVKYPGNSESDGVLAGDVVVTEKLDGANFRFTVNENNELVFGSRNVVFTKHGEPLPIGEMNKSFRHAARYIEDSLEPEHRELLQGWTLYGEAMHKHSLDYTGIEWEQPSYGGSPYARNVPSVLFFDARDSSGWVDWRNFEQLLRDVGLVSVPVLEKGVPSELDLDIPTQSVYGEDAEGIVVRRFDGSVRAKKVSEDFKEQHKQQKTSNRSESLSEGDRFVDEYVTDARIEKTVHKLVDEGGWGSIEMSMMEDLPRAVIIDALEESDVDHEFSDGSDFMGDVRSGGSSRCAGVLKSMLNSF